MSLTVQEDKKNVGKLFGKLTPRVFEVIRDMPGRKKWVDRTLLFEMTRANVEYLNEKLPEINWETERVNVVIKLYEDEALARNLRDSKRPLPPEALNFRYKTQPMDHQQSGFFEVRDKEYFGLFWEQGLGKTKTIWDIAAYKWSKSFIDTVLIVAPNGVQTQWLDPQMRDHLPDWVSRKCVVYSTTHTKKWIDECESVFSYQEGLRVFSINPESLITPRGESFVKRILMSGKVFWVLDESLSIKNPSSKRTKAILKLRNQAQNRAILTGTPVSRGVEDLYSQLKFLHEDILGFSSYYSFRNHFCITRQVPGAPQGVSEIVGYRNLPELQDKMNAYCIRKTALECLNLPERIYTERPVELTAEQKRLYKSMVEDMIAQVETGEIATAEQAAVKLMRLQQIVCGHLKDESGTVHLIPSNRISAAKDFIDQADDKVIVWCRFHQDIDLLKIALKNYEPVIWDGRVTTEGKAQAKEGFINDPRKRVLLANQAAAGTGLDGLQKCCHTMLYYSNGFRPTDRWQSEARLHRYGQQGTVIVGDLVAQKTVDAHILRVLKLRKNTADTVLGDNAIDFIKKLKADL